MTRAEIIARYDVTADGIVGASCPFNGGPAYAISFGSPGRFPARLCLLMNTGPRFGFVPSSRGIAPHGQKFQPTPPSSHFGDPSAASFSQRRFDAAETARWRADAIRASASIEAMT